MKRKLIIALLPLSLSISNPAYANEAEIALLKAQMKEMQRQMENMQQKLDAYESQPREMQQAAASGEKVKVTFHPSPRIESADGKFSFQPFGRVHLDYTVFRDDKYDHASNADFRRARIGFSGKFAEDFSYKSEFDFAHEGVAFKDVYMAYTGFDNASIRLGHFKPMLGLEENTSSNYLQFIERSSPSNTFARDHEIGLAVYSGEKDWSFAMGAFSGDAGDKSTEDEAYSFDIRGSFAPINNDNRVLHTGVAGSYRSNDIVEFDAKSSGTGADLVSTGALRQVDSTTVVGAELAGIYESLSVQGEYFVADVKRNAAENASFDGWVVQAAYTLTGESRPYDGKTGNFGRIRPANPLSLTNGGSGAWELAARYEDLNLNDAEAGIMGGRLKNIALGLNWYITDNTRLMFNYIDVNTDQNAVIANDDPQIYTARAAWDF